MSLHEELQQATIADLRQALTEAEASYQAQIARLKLERNGFLAAAVMPNLGYVTTRQLLLEIKARGELENLYAVLGNDMAIGAASLLEKLPGSMLDYRTVDS